MLATFAFVYTGGDDLGATGCLQWAGEKPNEWHVRTQRTLSVEKAKKGFYDDLAGFSED